MKPLRIFKGVTSYHANIKYNNEAANVFRELTVSKLMDRTFDIQSRRWVTKNSYLWYDDVNMIVYLPIYTLDEALERLTKCNIEYVFIDETYAIEPAPSIIKLNDDIIARKGQQSILDNITEPYGRYGLELQAGKGKTLTSLMVINKFKLPALIICKGLTEQWAGSIKKFTNCYDDIWMISGRKSIESLWESDFKPPIIVASLNTLDNYVKGKKAYGDMPTYYEFLKEYNIGIKVIDEVHLNFAMSTRLDVASYNVPLNLYLTATFMANADDTSVIFNNIYPPSIRLKGEGYHKYIHGVVCKYYSGVPEHTVMKARGYSHVYFEKWMAKHKTCLLRLGNAVITMINTYYIPHRGSTHKCLIWMQMKENINALCELLSRVYPELKIGRYVSGDPEEVILGDTDIIVSTHGSAGTGTDIPGLITTINTVSIGVQMTTEQLKGRTRFDKDAHMTHVDMWDCGIPRQRDHMDSRRLQLEVTCVDMYNEDCSQLGQWRPD